MIRYWLKPLDTDIIQGFVSEERWEEAKELLVSLNRVFIEWREKYD